MTHKAGDAVVQLVRPDEASAIDLAALQGLWTEALYLKMTDQTSQLIEFTDGVVELLPMPARDHQAISRLLFLVLSAFVGALGGTVFYAPLRLQLRPGKFREPDLLLLLDADDPRNQNRFWLGADLVVEIVSPDDPERDTVVKRADYEEARIPEYWIVNPLDESVTVLALGPDGYAEHGRFGRGERASSRLLDGFAISVSDLFDAR